MGDDERLSKAYGEKLDHEGEIWGVGLKYLGLSCGNCDFECPNTCCFLKTHVIKITWFFCDSFKHENLVIVFDCTLFYCF